MECRNWYYSVRVPAAIIAPVATTILRYGAAQRSSKAFSYGLIDDEQAWIALLNARNQTSHIYDDATAQEIYSQIESEFVSLFDKLIEQLKCG